MMLSPFPENGYFVVVYEYSYGSKYTCYPDVIFTYSDCFNHKYTGYPLTDCFVRSFETEEKAKEYIDEHETEKLC